MLRDSYSEITLAVSWNVKQKFVIPRCPLYGRPVISCVHCIRNPRYNERKSLLRHLDFLPSMTQFGSLMCFQRAHIVTAVREPATMITMTMTMITYQVVSVSADTEWVPVSYVEAVEIENLSTMICQWRNDVPPPTFFCINDLTSSDCEFRVN